MDDGVLLASVVQDVRVALASLVATLVLAALWYVLRVAWDVDVHRRPRASSAKEALSSASADVREQTRTVVARARPAASAAAKARSASGTVAVAAYPKAPARFYEVIERARAEILSRITETRWARIAGENNIDIYCLPDPPRPDRYKAVIQIKAPPEAVLRAMYDLKLRANWDEAMVVGEHNRTVVYFADSLSITYYRVGAMGAVSSRDFLDLRSLCQLEGNQGFLVVFYSVAWPDQPLVPGVVRAMNLATAQLIRRLPDNTSEVTNFVQSDLGGWLPTRLIRLAIGGSMTAMFRRLRLYCEQQATALMMDANEIERYVAAAARAR